MVATGEAVIGRVACMLAVRAGLAFALALAAAAPVFAEATRDLFAAAKGGTASEASAAIAVGADPNARDVRGRTPFHWAVVNPEPSVIAALIEAGADPNARDDARGRTPLHLAAAVNPKPSVVGALIEGGADVDARDGNDRTPLHWAEGGNPKLSVVAALIAAGADPNARTESGFTPFDYAKHNEALRGTEVYRRLDEARFE